MKRLLICLATLWLSCFAAVSITSISDVSGDGAAHPIATSGSAYWIQLRAPSTNSSTVRWGSSSVSASNGNEIAAGGSQFLPIVAGANGGAAEYYSLSGIYYLIQAGDKLEIVYAK